MKQTITKNSRNMLFLQKLIDNGHYKGSISSERFELSRNHFPNNFGIIGVLRDDGKFVVRSDYTKLVGFLSKTFNFLGILFSLGLVFFQSNWTIALIYFIIRLISHLNFKVRTEKEMDLFTTKFLELLNSYSDKY